MVSFRNHVCGLFLETQQGTRGFARLILRDVMIRQAFLK